MEDEQKLSFGKAQGQVKTDFKRGEYSGRKVKI
jgi:hypothetical protein